MKFKATVITQNKEKKEIEIDAEDRASAISILRAKGFLIIALVVSESKPNFKQKVTSTLTPHRKAAIDKKTKWLIGLAFLSVILNLSELDKFLSKPNTNATDSYNKGLYSKTLPLRQLTPSDRQRRSNDQLNNANDSYKKGQYSAALPLYLLQAELGNAHAQAMLGLMYSRGQGAAKDYIKAVYWSKKAAEQGDKGGQTMLGLLYHNGQGVAQDYTQSLYWTKKAAEQGSAAAQHNLAIAYGSGQGVTQDDAQALYWCKKAVEQGNAGGQDLLGYMYYNGKGVAQDYTQALYWYKKAMEEHGNAMTQNMLGIMNVDDIAEADAQSNLGLMYYEGHGVAQDYKQALDLYKKAAEYGAERGQVYLGRMYYEGRGVAQDYTQALYWYKKAAEQGSAGGQSWLGIMYYSGKGVAQDYTQALYWYKKAAEQGEPTAQNMLGRINKEQGIH